MKTSVALRLAAAGLILCAVPASSADPLGPEAKAALAEMPEDVRAKVLEFEASLHPQSGTIQVPGAHATLKLGNDYYFLPAADAKRVLTEAWGNPPDSVTDVLGMVFPKGRTSYDGVWGAIISYEDTGHINDEDAAEQDYEQVLADMKAGEEEENKARREAGYAGSVTVGWAQAPTYDAASKTLIWARNIKFDGAEGNTLNYDVRTLARTGVLSMNMVDSMNHLPVVKAAAVDLAKTVELSPGSRYAEYDSSTDATAEYGLAGLVAAGAGVAVAKKAGLLAILLLVLKKGFVFILAGAAAAWAWFKRRVAKNEESDADSYEDHGEAMQNDTHLEQPSQGESKA
ncbi:MAG TPA: DUF2167 domain-containing protein [Sphingomicrobium sp.]|nr:DUF2167 domain-containing protein [Sphingomicrobium sp.]